jgi:glycerol-3-phosphate responsive antiterminator
VPLFDGTSPRQHIVVQYSVHKIDADGTITHKEALIDGSIANNKAIIDQLYHDLE